MATVHRNRPPPFLCASSHADGFCDNAMYIQCMREGELCVQEFESCVFQLQVRQNYHALVALNHHVASLGISGHLSAEDEHLLDEDALFKLQRLKEQAHQEAEQNRDDSAIYLGREVRFSDSFQLRHVKSGKFLKIFLDNAADAEGNRVPVRLSDDGTASCFRFRSRHKLKLADESVGNLEPVSIALESLSSTHSLDCNFNMNTLVDAMDPPTRHPVSAYGQGLCFLVQCYCRETPSELRTSAGLAEDAFDRNVEVSVYCGRVVRLLHDGLDAFLATTPSVHNPGAESSDSLVVLEQADGFDRPGAADVAGAGGIGTLGGVLGGGGVPPSAHTLWLVESVNPGVGSILRYDEPIRLRNVATGAYLVPRRGGVAAKCIRKWTEGDGKSGAINSLSASILRLGRLPEHFGHDDAVNKRSVVWLSFGDLHVRVDHDAGLAGVGPKLVLRPQLGDRDGFTVYPIEQCHVTDTFQVVSVCKAARDFVSRVKRTLEFDPSACLEMSQILRELSQSLERSGAGEGYGGTWNDVWKRQTLIRELQLMELMVQITDARHWNGVLRGGSGALMRGVKHSKDWVHVRCLWEDAFQLLYLTVRENHPNGLDLAKHLEVLLFHMTDREGGGWGGGEAVGEDLPRYVERLQKLVLEIYCENPAALSVVQEKDFELFSSLLASQTRLTPVYLRFLNVLAHTREGGIPANQKLLCGEILGDRGSTWVPETVARGEGVLVCLPAVGGGQLLWQNIHDVAMDPVVCEYYTEFIELLSTVVRGRSRINIENLSRLSRKGLISYDVCLKCLLDDSLPSNVRAAYVNLFSNAFVDAHPQEDRCKIEHLQVWGDLYEEPLKTNAFVSEVLDQFAAVKDFALAYLEDHDVQGLDNAVDTLTLAVVRLIHTLILYGFYNYSVHHVWTCKYYENTPAYRQRFEDLRASVDPLKHNANWQHDVLETRILLQPMMLLLDSSTDNVQEGSRHRPAKVVVETKKCLCECLAFMISIRLKLRVNRVLRVYDSDLQNGLVFQVDDSESPFSQGNSRTKQPLAPRVDFENLFRIMEHDRPLLTRILADLLKFRDRELDNCALQLVLSVHGQRDEMVVALQKTELLVDQTVVHLHFEHKAIMVDVRELVLKLRLCEQEASKRRQQFHREQLRQEQEELLQEAEDATPSPRSPDQGGVGGLGVGAVVAGARNLFDGIMAVGGFVGFGGLGSGGRPVAPEKSIGTGGKGGVDSMISRSPAASPGVVSRRVQSLGAGWGGKGGRGSGMRGSLAIRGAGLGPLNLGIQEGVEVVEEEGLSQLLVESSEKLIAYVRKMSTDCQEALEGGGTAMALGKIQNGLRDLGVHEQVMMILEALHQDGNIPEAGPLKDLAAECFNLLTHMAFNNVRNAATLFSHIDLFLSYLANVNGLEFRADETIASLFHDNRLLCTQASGQVERQIVSLVCLKGQHYPYIKLLTVLMRPHGVAIKRSQVRILRLLDAQKEKTLSLYQGPQGLATLRMLMMQQEHLGRDASSGMTSGAGGGGRKKGKKGESLSEEPAPEIEDGVRNVHPRLDSRVLYYLYTIRMFTASCAGNNHVTESMCARMFPLQRATELITASWCTPGVKVAVLEFVLEGHLMVEHRAEGKEKLRRSPAMWMMLDYFGYVLGRIADPVGGGGKGFCVPREHDGWTKKIVGAFLPVCRTFISDFFRVRRAQDDEIRIANGLCDALVQFWGGSNRTPQDQTEVANVLQVLEQRDVQGSEGTRRLLKTLLQAARMNLQQRGVANEMTHSMTTKVMTLYSSFRANFRQRINFETELRDMIEVCRQHPRAVSVITNQLTALDADRGLKRKYIRVLQVLWETLTNDMSVEESMNAIGLDVVIAAIMQLVSHGSGDEVAGALNLANSLLEQGGHRVQKKFYDALNRGTAEGFLRELHVRIEMAAEEVKESKAIVMQVVLNAKPEPGRRKTLHMMMEEANIVAEQDEASEGGGKGGVGGDKSFVKEVLTLLKNLCEGHFLPMQNLLRKQHASEHSVDLVTAVAVFITEIEGAISPLNVHVASQAFQTLIEFLQGPCKGNIYAVLKTGLCEAVNRIIVNTHAKLEGVFYPSNYYQMVRSLKADVAVCVLAMLEGASFSDPRIPNTLIRSLDLTALVDYAISMYSVWKSARQRQQDSGLDVEDKMLDAMNRVAISTGFSYYVMLRTIADFETEPNGALDRLFDQSIAAIAYYSKGTGCLEISKDRNGNAPPELLRIYFQVPNICSRITDDMKNTILWGVDRSNDVTRLRDFFSRVDDLYQDMKYQQWLNRNTVTVLIRKIGRVADFCYLGNVILMNIMLLIFFKWRPPLDSDPDATWNELMHVQLEGAELNTVQYALPTIQLVLEGVMLINYSITKVPDFVRRRFKNEFYDKAAEKGVQDPIFDYQSLPRNIGFFLNYARHALSDNALTAGQCFFWRLVTFLLSLSINSTTTNTNQLPLLLYCFLLWEVFPRSKQIGFVLRAVLMGGRALLSLAGMLVIFTYWFGAIGFLFFPDKFQFRRAEVIDGNTVQNSPETGFGNNRAVPLKYVWQGMLMVIDQGVRKEDVGEALDKLPWPLPCPDPALYGCAPCPSYRTYECIKNTVCDDPRWQAKVSGAYSDITTCGDVFNEWPQSKIFIRMVYTFFFFVMVVAVALEIVFGVIVDSFKKLREEREETLKDIKYKCFICGINRNQFDSTAPGGFDFHTHNEHNMWVYMYYLIHIREKEDKTDLNGVEHYVHSKSLERDVSFFPVGRAICLDQNVAMDPEKEMRRAKTVAVQELENQHRHWTQRMGFQIEKLMNLCGLGSGGHTLGEGAGGDQSLMFTESDADAEPDDRPSAVAEVSRRIQIRKAYSPLDVFVVPHEPAPARSPGLGASVDEEEDFDIVDDLGQA